MRTLIRFRARLEVDTSFHQDHLFILFIKYLLIFIKRLGLVNALASHHHVAGLAEVAVVVVDVDHRLGLVVLPSKTFEEVVVFVHLLA